MSLSNQPSGPAQEIPLDAAGHGELNIDRQAEAEPEIKPSLGANLQSLKIAIVCDWLTGTGGAERVVLELHKLFPAAPIYASQYDKDPKIWYGDTWFNTADVRTGWLQKLPKKLKKFLPVLRARYFSSLDLSEYDMVIASSGAEAKAVKTGPNTKLIWYCHAPTHYYWSRYDEYIKHPGFGALNPLARLGLFLLVRPLRRWDYKAAQRSDLVLANSTHIQAEIKKYYNRESTVVFPPVDTSRFKTAAASAGSQVGGTAVAQSGEPKAGRPTESPLERFGFVTAGRQTPYKRIDLAVEACSRLNLPLTVIGSGPEHNKLTAMAGQSVRFLSGVSDADIAYHFKMATAFIFPGIDDFGIVAVEALSAGTPVIAFKAGGALDYVHEGVSGSFFEQQTVASLTRTLRAFQPEAYASSATVAESEKYSTAVFASHITATLEHYMADHQIQQSSVRSENIKLP